MEKFFHDRPAHPDVINISALFISPLICNTVTY